MNPFRFLVAGAGVFGQNHLRVIHESPEAELAGVYDTDPARAAAATAQYGCAALTNLSEAAGRFDAAIVATPTTSHAKVACALLEQGLDVLVEKPIAPSVADARLISGMAARHGRILQVGHLERFNPAVSALSRAITIPLFFEIHRMSVFTPRSLDVDVVLDLMIHDLEIVLGLVGKQPEEIRAAGISILSDRVDIANVRLAFPGGCIANLTASRISTEKVRKLRLFQPNQYISLDYSRQDAMAFTVSDNRQIGFEPLGVTKGEPLKLQLASFIESMWTRNAPLVGGEQATSALALSMNILDRIREHSGIVAATLGATERQGAAS